jgi:hypothetical protein
LRQFPHETRDIRFRCDFQSAHKRRIAHKRIKSTAREHFRKFLPSGTGGDRATFAGVSGKLVDDWR